MLVDNAFGNSAGIMPNAETLRAMMDNPLVQSMMTNPDIVRNIISSNPQLQQLMEVSPLPPYFLQLRVRVCV